ncbi:MAG: hypothetical protein ABGX83_04665 [Nitrospira sp.]|nr:hypothetical protein [Candidatus Manganitrophaceae bacterium]HIL35679.1 hypothetical protein [Candidatus Manganitrophaceae bacterium]
MLNFNLCGEAINVNPTDVPVCRVTPPMIPPGADTQVGTGLNPIIGTGTDVGASFGGLTNDSVPSGTSNVTIPGFLIHGGTFLSNPMSGEVTNNCNSEATCGQTVNRNIITHFQSFRSVPNGGIIDPNVPSVFCDQPRCNHIEFSIQQDMTGAAAAQTAMRFDFVIDSKNDANGDIIVTAPGTPTGTFTVTCLPGSNACTNTSGNFRVNTSTFTSASTGFVTMNDSPVVNPVGCPTGTLVDPFHQNGVSCQSN